MFEAIAGFFFFAKATQFNGTASSYNSVAGKRLVAHQRRPMGRQFVVAVVAVVVIVAFRTEPFVLLSTRLYYT